MTKNKFVLKYIIQPNGKSISIVNVKMIALENLAWKTTSPLIKRPTPIPYFHHLFMICPLSEGGK